MSMVVTPVSVTPSMIAALDRGRAAVGGQQREVDVHAGPARRGPPSRRIWPNATTASASAPAAAMLRDDLRVVDRPRAQRPGCRAPPPPAATGVGAGGRERPRARSGWVTTTRHLVPRGCASARSGRDGGGGAAREGDPHPGPQPPSRSASERLPALLGRRAVEDQDAVEVVDLVLDDPGGEALGLELEGAARRCPAASTRIATARGTSTLISPIERHPSKSVSSSSDAPGDARVAEDDRGLVLAAAHDRPGGAASRSAGPRARRRGRRA